MKEPVNTSISYAEHCGRIEESHYNTVELNYYPERKHGYPYMAHTGLDAQFSHGNTAEEALSLLLKNVEAMRTELLEMLGIAQNDSNKPDNTPIVDYYVDDVELQQMIKANRDDAGFDVRCKGSYVVYANDTMAVETGLHVSIPRGYVGILKARSGLALSTGYSVGAGVIDSGYTGQVRVLVKAGAKDITFNNGDKIAQMIVIPCAACARPVSCIEALGMHERGDKGFGSSGR